MKTNSRQAKRPAEAKTPRTAQRKGDYVQRLVSRHVAYGVILTRKSDGHQWLAHGTVGRHLENKIKDARHYRDELQKHLGSEKGIVVKVIVTYKPVLSANADLRQDADSAASQPKETTDEK